MIIFLIFALVIVPAVLFPISFVSLIKSNQMSAKSSNANVQRDQTAQTQNEIGSTVSHASDSAPSKIVKKEHIKARIKAMGPILLVALLLFLIPIILISSGVQIGSLSTQRIACAKLGFLSTQSDKCLNDISMAMQTSYYELLMNIMMILSCP